MTPTRPGSERVAAARLVKARQFADAASLLIDDDGSTDQPDAYVTHAVHAGIAAADALCIRGLGQYSASGAHDEAVALLQKVDSQAAAQLHRLLGLKTKAGYSAVHASNSDVTTARRAHRALLERARTP